MKKFVARLPHIFFVFLLVGHIFSFSFKLIMAQAQVRAAAALLTAVVALLIVSAAAHFIPPINPNILPTLSTSTNKITLTKPQLTQAKLVWSQANNKQPNSEMINLTLWRLCQVDGDQACQAQTKQKLEYLNPALLSPTPENK